MLWKGLRNDGKKYTKKERSQAVTLAQETNAKTTSKRLEVNLDTLYTWISKAKRAAALNEEASGSEGQEGVRRLKKKNHKRREEIEILQNFLAFFVKRRRI